MYKIEKTDFGIKATFKGFTNTEEMNSFVKESSSVVDSLAVKSSHVSGAGKFNILMDLRDVASIPQDAATALLRETKTLKNLGLDRSVVILGNTAETLNLNRMAKEAGVQNYERNIDASKIKNWEKKGMEWLIKGIEP